NFPLDLREERLFEEPKWHCRPLLWRTAAGEIRGHYIRRFIMDSQRHSGAPRLTPLQLEALDAFDSVLARRAGETAFMPGPGDLLVLDNYRVMHARSSFTDDDASPRLALRTWVAPFASEPLPASFQLLAGSCDGGVLRGGVGNDPDYLRRIGTQQSYLMERT